MPVAIPHLKALFCIGSSILLMLSAPCAAQTSSSSSSSRDEEIRRMMESTANPVVPSAARMADAVLDAELRFAERPDTANRIAAFKRNLYEALMRKGFTAEQSMQIVLQTPVPSAAAGGR
jgi:hypothetical protein